MLFDLFDDEGKYMGRTETSASHKVEFVVIIKCLFIFIYYLHTWINTNTKLK